MRDLTDAIPGSNGAVSVGSDVSGSAGAVYGSTEQAMLNDLASLVNQLRAALVSNGIVV
jgi:hypothetical protein